MQKQKGLMLLHGKKRTDSKQSNRDIGGKCYICTESQVAGPWGRHRSQELVSRNFVRDKLSENVAGYMAGCIKCHKSKADGYSWQTNLVPILIGERALQEIAMDCVAELPESELFNPMLVVTDQFTKVQGYIAAKTTCTAENNVDLYLNNIWKLNGLSRQITSDCALQCAPKLLKEMNSSLNVN